MRLLYILLTLCVLHVTQGQTADECQPYYTVVLGVKFAGGAQGGANNVGDCRSECEKDTACLGFDFNKVNQCFLTKVDVGETSDTNVDHYYRQQACDVQKLGERCFFDYRAQRKSDISYGPLRGSVNITDCFATCLRFEDCGGINWNSTDGNCEITPISLGNYTVDTKEEAGAEFFQWSNCTKVPFNTVCTKRYELIANRQQSGGSIVTSNKTVGDCQNTCNAIKDCTAIDFNSQKGECYILNGEAGTSAVQTNPDVDQYRSIQECSSMDTCKYNFFADFVPKTDHKSTPIAGIISATECLGACNDDAMCVGISFNDLYKFDCRMYTDAAAYTLDGNNMVQADDGRISLGKISCTATSTTAPTVAPGTCTWDYNEHLNMKLTGATRISVSGTVDACKTSCNVQKSCTGIDYQKTAKECWHHNNRPYPTLSPSLGNIEDHYDKFKKCSDCSFNYYPGQYGGAGDVQSSHTTEDDCILACSSNSACRAASFNTLGNVCTFYPNDRLTSLTGVTTAAHLVKTTCLTDVTGCTFNYVEQIDKKVPGGIRNAVATEDACKAECSKDPSCFAIDFNSQNQCYILRTYGDIVSEVGVRHLHIQPKCNSSSRADCSFFAYGNSWPKATVGRTDSSKSLQACFSSCIDATSPACSGIAYDTNICYMFNKDISWLTNDVQPGSATLRSFRFDSCSIEPTTTTVSTTTVTSGTTTADCPNTWVKTENQHGLAGLLQSDIISNLALCQARCIARTDCRGIDFDNNSGSCYIHTQTDVEKKLQPLNRVDFYFLQRCSTTSVATASTTTTAAPQSCTPAYQKFTDQKKFGGSSTAAKTPVSCQSTCEAAPTCTGYDFGRLSSTCFLHNNPIAQLVDAKTEQVDHYGKRWNCSGCVYTPYPNRNAPGGSQRTALKTANTCILGCTGDPQCLAVDVNINDNSCFFFTTAVAPADLQTAAGIVHWIKGTCVGVATVTSTTSTTARITTTTTITTTPAPAACERTYREFKAKKTIGAAQVQGISTLQACQDSCTGKASCFSIDYNTGGNTCWQQSAVVLQLVDIQGEAVDHYTKALKCKDCSYEVIPGKTPPSGGSVQTTLTSVANCLDTCSLRVTCFGLTYSATNVCTFFTSNTRVNLANAPATTTYYDKYNCKDTCRPIYSKNDNMKSVGGTQAPVATSALCAQSCTANKDCAGYDFNRLKNECWLQLGRPSPFMVPAGTEGVDHWQKTGYDCDVCDYTIVAGKAVTGATGSTLAGVADVEACISKCSSESNCRAIEFDRNTNACVSFPSATAANTLVDNVAKDYLEKGTCTNTGTATTPGPSTATTLPTSSCTVQYSVTANSKVVGGTQSTGSNTVDLCKAACQADQRCVGFDFASSDSSCWLTIGIPDNIVSSGTELVTHYDLYWQCGSCRYDPMADKAGSGGTVLAGTFNEITCVAQCSVSTGCKAVDFNGATCTSYSTPPAVTDRAGTRHWVEVACTGVSTAAPTQSTRACSPLYEPVLNQKVSGGVFKDGVNSVVDCTATCEQDPFCIGFDFNSIGSACWLTVDAAQAQVPAPNTNTEQVTHYTRKWTCNGCVFVPFSKRGASGGIQNAPITENSCATQCSTNPTCTDINWDRNNNLCFLFFVDAAPATGPQYAGVIHWEKQGQCPAGSGTTAPPTPPPAGTTTIAPPTTTTTPSGTTRPAPTCTITYIVSPNTHMIGGQIQDATVNTVDACKGVCEATLSECIGFDFDSNNRCWIIPSAAVGTPLQTQTGTTHYTLVFNCGGCRYQPYLGKRFNLGGTFPVSAIGRDACLFACNPAVFTNPNPACTNINLNQDGSCVQSSQGNTVLNLIDDNTATHFIRLDCGEVAADSGVEIDTRSPTST